MGYGIRAISVQNEEREAYLDTFSTCETCFREEMSLANQLFDDLGRYCPTDLETCEPLQMSALCEESARVRFILLLQAVGIATAEELSQASGVDAGACSAVLSSPLRCNGNVRARIMGALEESQDLDIWNQTDPLTGDSVGKCFADWTRENFKTPWQFKRQAEECELKCYMIGAVGQLSSVEIENLLYAPNLLHALKNAASAAKVQRERDRWAAQAISGAIESLSNAKRSLEEASACVPKVHDKGQAPEPSNQ